MTKLQAKLINTITLKLEFLLATDNYFAETALTAVNECELHTSEPRNSNATETTSCNSCGLFGSGAKNTVYDPGEMYVVTLTIKADDPL